jgi:heme-degrading monooxygenase HmoA
VIARTWRGWASTTTAEDYQRHYETDVAEHLRAVPGFRGAQLLRRDAGDEVLFTSITYFSSMDAVRAFAGDDPERAVVEEAARRALTRWDDRVSHDTVVVELPRPPAETDSVEPGLFTGAPDRFVDERAHLW